MFRKDGRGIASAIGLIVGILLTCIILPYRPVVGEGGIKPQKLTILFTGDDWGMVKPCGCGYDRDLGGLARRATYIKKVLKSEGEVLLLDAGDTFGGYSGAFANIKIKFYSEFLNYTGYEAVGMGEWEILYSLESGLKRFFGQSIHLLCANVVDASSGKLIAEEPFMVKKLQSGLRVGIISVLGEDRIDQSTLQKWQIRILPPADALSKYLPELKKKSDLIVLLSHTQADKAKQLAAEVPGIDVVIGGHISPLSSDFPEQVGTAIFMQTRSAGKYVGKLVLEIGADRKIASFSGEYVPMGSDIEDDPKVAEMVKQHDQEVAAFYSRTIPQPSVDVGPKPFVSSTKCGECHSAEFASWSKTAHKMAFEALRKDNRTGDPECVKCHTTGSGSKGGFISETATPHLLGVQCEMCHGPGVIHVRKPEKGYGAVSESTCRRCHDQPNSPGFKYQEYRKKILHKQAEAVEVK